MRPHQNNIKRELNCQTKLKRNYTPLLEFLFEVKFSHNKKQIFITNNQGKSINNLAILMKLYFAEIYFRKIRKQ